MSVIFKSEGADDRGARSTAVSSPCPKLLNVESPRAVERTLLVKKSRRDAPPAKEPRWGLFYSYAESFFG
jgi:hypothetical protein